MSYFDKFDRMVVAFLLGALFSIGLSFIVGDGGLEDEVKRLEEKDSEAIVILKEQTDLLKTKLKEERRTVVQMEKKIEKMKAEHKRFARLTGQLYGTRKE